MSGQRVALITPRFWPLVGETEMAIADLAVALQGAGHRPAILTARWNKIWPLKFAYEDVPVERVAVSPKGLWGTWRYMRGVDRWLRAHGGELDAVVVAGLRHDAMASVGAMESSTVPVLLLADGNDAHWHTTTRLGGMIRRRCQRADAFVVPDDASRSAVAAAGFPNERLHVIPPGVPIPAPTTGDARGQARRALSRAMGGPVIGALAPLAVHVGVLEATADNVALLNAWRQIVARWPQAQLWLLGEGAGRMALFEQIEQRGLVGRVLMPGQPESLDDLLAAADMYIAPANNGPASRFVLLAMAAGLPVVAADTPAHSQFVTNNQTGLLFSPNDSDDAAAMIGRLLQQPTLATGLAENGRQRCMSEFSMERYAAQLLDVI